MEVKDILIISGFLVLFVCVIVLFVLYSRKKGSSGMISPASENLVVAGTIQNESLNENALVMTDENKILVSAGIGPSLTYVNGQLDTAQVLTPLGAPEFGSISVHNGAPIGALGWMKLADQEFTASENDALLSVPVQGDKSKLLRIIAYGKITGASGQQAFLGMILNDTTHNGSIYIGQFVNAIYSVVPFIPVGYANHAIPYFYSDTMLTSSSADSVKQATGTIQYSSLPSETSGGIPGAYVAYGSSFCVAVADSGISTLNFSIMDRTGKALSGLSFTGRICIYTQQ